MNDPAVLVHLLPYVEQQNLYNSSLTTYSGVQAYMPCLVAGVYSAPVKVFQCPSDSSSVRTVTQGVSYTTWWFAFTPAGGEPMPSDW